MSFIGAYQEVADFLHGEFERGNRHHPYLTHYAVGARLAAEGNVGEFADIVLAMLSEEDSEDLVRRCDAACLGFMKHISRGSWQSSMPESFRAVAGKRGQVWRDSGLYDRAYATWPGFEADQTPVRPPIPASEMTDPPYTPTQRLFLEAQKQRREEL